ncbi:MAG: AMP-binding protein, partial [Promethearchaeota archaeon]
MENPYENRFWRKSWDKGLADLDSSLWETSYSDAVRDTFEKFPEKMALAYQGLEIPYKDVDIYSNQFANMLVENGFKKGDVVGINLPNIPEYIYALLGTLKAGCIVSGVSPLMSDVQMHYQIDDLGSGGKNVALVTLDAIFQHRLKNIADKLPQLKLVVTTSVIGSFDKESREKIRAVREIPFGEVTPLKDKIVLDFQDDVLVKYPKNLPNVNVTPDDIAFIQYTGGTTGPPKGAMLTHRNCVSDLLIVQRWLDWERGAGVALSGFPFFHIAGTFFLENCIYLGW